MICEHCGSTRKRTACYWPDNSIDADGRRNGGDRLCPCDNDAYDAEYIADWKRERRAGLLTMACVIAVIAAIGFAMTGCAALEITRCVIVQNNANLKCN